MSSKPSLAFFFFAGALGLSFTALKCSKSAPHPRGILQSALRYRLTPPGCSLRYFAMERRALCVAILLMSALVSTNASSFGIETHRPSSPPAPIFHHSRQSSSLDYDPLKPMDQLHHAEPQAPAKPRFPRFEAETGESDFLNLYVLFNEHLSAKSFEIVAN